MAMHAVMSMQWFMQLHINSIRASDLWVQKQKSFSACSRWDVIDRLHRGGHQVRDVKQKAIGDPHRGDLIEKQSLGPITPAGDGVQHWTGKVCYLLDSIRSSSGPVSPPILSSALFAFSQVYCHPACLCWIHDLVHSESFQVPRSWVLGLSSQ